MSGFFDEVVIKERLKVEGGTSRTILSNFDGPVNFSKDVRFDAITNISKRLTLSGGEQSFSVSSGDLVVTGGVGIGKSVYIGGDLNVTGTVLGGKLQFGNILIAQTDDNTIDTTLGPLMLNSASGITSVRDNLTVDNTLTVDDNTTLNGITTITPTSGSTFVVLSETDSSSKTTGAVVVSGGVGIGKELHVGGDITAFASSDINLKENIVGGFIAYLSASLLVLILIIVSGSKFRNIYDLNNKGVKWFILTGFLGFLSHLFRYMALGVAPITIVEPIQRSTIIFRVIFGWLLNRQHEIINKTVLFGIMLSVAGVYLIIYQI